MVATYKKPMPMFVRGEGCYLYDVENRKYLDFTAGIAVNSLGHADKAFVKVIAQQVDAPAPRSSCVLYGLCFIVVGEKRIYPCICGLLNSYKLQYMFFHCY